MTICFMLSIYSKTSVSEFIRAFKSIDEQEDVSVDLLINIDGPISEELNQCIAKLSTKKALKKIKIYKSSENRGLAASMNRLILEEFSNYDFFLRQDCDDYSATKRCKLQVSFLERNPLVDSVGSYFQSFNKNSLEPSSVSVYPSDHESISLDFASKAPIAHATICFRKSFFIKAGIYAPDHTTYAEDTRLWYSGLYTGCVFANIPKVLYYVAEDESQYQRRSGLLQIITIFKVRVRYIVHARLGIFALFRAFLELALRLLVSIIVFSPFKKYTSPIISIYKKQHKYR